MMDAKPSLFIPSTSAIAENAERSSKSKCESTYINDSHTVKAFEDLQSLREDENSCDIKLKADDDTIVFAHKIVLMSASHYFQDLFTQFSERNKDIVYIRDVKSTILKLIVDYFYTLKIVISDENVQELIPAAIFLQLDWVKSACVKFIEKRLDPLNCIGFRSLAILYNCSELFSTCDLYIRQQFEDVTKGEEFMSLSTEELIKLISGNVLNATEVKVYECVINWVKHRLNDRSDSLPILMEYVRLPLVSLEYISNNVVKEPLFKNLPKSKDYLTEAYQFHALKTQQIETIPQTIRNTPRMSGHKVIIMIEYAHSDCWYDPTTNKWHILNTKCNHTLSYVDFDRSALIKDQYVVSYSYPELRIIGFRIKSSCKTYFLLTSVPRRNFGFCVLDHNLYAVGGSGKGGYLTSSEVFDLNNFNDRRMIANMSTKRSNLGVGVLNGLLYAVGGITNDSMQLKSVECYDPKLDTWTPVAEMRACRYDVGVGQMDGVLYAVGGKYGNRCLSSVEAYNPSTGVWTSIANMHKARSGSSVFAIDGLLYVIGGYDGRYPGVGISIITNRKVAPAKQLNSVEIYNPDTNSWSIKNMSWKMNDILGGIIVDKALFREWKEP